MLKLMHKLSQDIENVNRYRPEMILRTAPKVEMKIEFTVKERGRRSPCYICKSLWGKCYSPTQAANSIFEFSNLGANPRNFYYGVPDCFFFS